MPERIVLLKQGQHCEIGQIAEDAGHGEPGVRSAPQRRRRAIVVEALQRHGAVRLELEDLVHTANGSSRPRAGGKPGLQIKATMPQRSRERVQFPFRSLRASWVANRGGSRGELELRSHFEFFYEGHGHPYGLRRNRCMT